MALLESVELALRKRRKELSAKTVVQLSKWHRTSIYVTMLFCNLWMGMSESAQAPFFPREAEKKGASPAVYGWIIGSCALTAVFAAPLSAKMVVYVRPTVLCYVSVFIHSWTIMLFGVLGWSPPGVEFVALSTVCGIINAFMYCAFFTSANSLLADIFPENRTVVLSAMETVYGLSFILGPALGGPLYQLGGYFLPFGVTGVFILVGSVLCFATMRSLDPEVSPLSGDMSGLVLDYGFMTSLLISGCSSIAIGFNNATLEPHVRQFHLTPSMVSIFFIAYSFTFCVSSLVWGWLCDKIGHEQPLIMSGIIITLFGYMLVGPVPFLPFEETVYSVVIAEMLLGIGCACEWFCCFSYMMKDVKERGFPDDIVTTTMVVGATLSSSSLGEFVGPVIGGFLLEHVGYNMATFYISGLHVVAGIIFSTGVIWKKLRGKTKVSKEENFHLTSF